MVSKMTQLPIKVTMVRTQDGATITYDYELYQDLPDYDGVYFWEHGNFSCDCNRGGDFYQYSDADPFDGEFEVNRDGDESHVCGDGGFMVELTDSTGKVWYTELGAPEDK